MSQATMLKYAAIAQVGRAPANELFLLAAKEVVAVVARYKKTFTTDDLWQFLIQGSGVEPRAMGAVMTWAEKKEICLATNTTTPSRRPQCHARPVRVWRSLLWKGDYDGR